ncbi:MAG: DUF433 domain-containing protein [Ignavibacteria bacterium]|nr:DUF433 domain-containing protein [Ignavibacteria bacterium]
MDTNKIKEFTEAITIDPEIMSGAPVFKGTRVTIQTLFDYLEEGYTLDDFVKHFDWVKKEHALAVLELAKNSFDSARKIKEIYLK